MAPTRGDIPPTETSPLLGNGSSRVIDGIDGSLGFDPNGPQLSAAESDPEQVPQDEEVNPLHEGLPEVAKRLHWLLPAIGIGVMLGAADQTIIVSSYARIGSELNALNSTSWIATAYFLTLTTFQPLYGKLSDIFGRKPCLLFAYIIFTLGCLFCGLARNIGELIAARAVAGIGGGGMMTVLSILMSDIIPLRERGSWQGYINVIYAIGSASGAPLGGILVDSIGWRWAFLFQVPLCLVAFLAVYFILDLPKIEDSHWRERLKKVDFLGAFCLIIATSSLLLGLDHGSNVGWNNTFTLVTTCLAAPLFTAFVYVEMKVAENPFAPGRIIFERSLGAAYLCNFFAFAGYISTIFYLPLFYQAVNGFSATEAGVLLIPGIIASATGSIGGGLIMQKTGKYYLLTIMAYTIMVLGHIPIIICTGLVVNNTYGTVFGFCLTAVGGGIGVTTSLIAIISNANPKDQAIATAISYLFRSLGSVVGLSLSATIVQQSLRVQLLAALQDSGRADEIVERVRHSLDSIKELDPHTREVVRLCYQRATGITFMFSLVILSGAMISSFFIREKRLSK